MLTFAGEILLLALDDERGTIKALPRISIETAIAAASMLELTFLRKIDAGPNTIYVIDTAPLRIGDQLTDEVLAVLASGEKEKPIGYWLNVITERVPNLVEKVINSLVAKKVLKVENQRILWFFAKRRYPMIDNRQITEVKARLRQIIENREIPDPRDMVLISLTRACRLFPEIFTPEEREKHLEYIDKIAKFDFVGQALSKSLRDIEQTVCLMNEAVYQYT